MTVNTSNYRIEYSGNGTTTVFAYNFRILDEDHVEVILVDSSGNETVQTKTTHYTVSGVGDAGGGDITMITAPASGASLVLRRSMPFTQDTDYTSGDPFPAETHEEALDELTMNDQELKEISDRSLRAPKQDAAIDDLPIIADRDGKLITFDSSGNPIATGYTSAQVQAAINAVTAGSAVTDTTTITHTNDATDFVLATFLNNIYTTNAKNEGATGDGTTDDTTALNTALAKGGKVHIPAGNYLISSTLEIPSDTEVYGDGQGITRIFCAENANLNMIQAETISSVSGEYDENIVLRDLTVDANRTQNFTAETLMSLLLVGTQNVRVERVHFKNPNTDGIYVNYEYAGTGHADNEPINIDVLNCLFTSTNYNRNGISIIGGYNIDIIGCRFIGMTRADMPAAIDLEPNNTNNLIEGVNISQCYFDNCKASIGADYVPNNSNTQIRNVNISDIIINDSIGHSVPTPSTTPDEFTGHVGIGMAHVTNVNIKNVNIKDTAHTSLWFADIDRLNIDNAICVAPTTPMIVRDCTDVNLNNFYFECENATVFTSVLTKGILMRYENTGAGHTGVRRIRISNGTINCTAGSATNNSAILGEGNIQDVQINNVHIMGKWANAIVQSNGSSGDALRWTVNATLEDGHSMVAYTSAFDGAITDSGNGEWNIPGETDGIASFSAETSKVITVGDFARLDTARMVVSAIDNQGTIGLSADRTSATQFTITASASHTGDVYWKIVHS